MVLIAFPVGVGNTRSTLPSVLEIRMKFERAGSSQKLRPTAQVSVALHAKLMSKLENVAYGQVCGKAGNSVVGKPSAVDQNGYVGEGGQSPLSGQTALLGGSSALASSVPSPVSASARASRPCRSI